MSTDKTHPHCLTAHELVHFKSIKASSAGKFLIDHLNNETVLYLRGITSRGVFIESGDGQILFISFELFRGPLTVNTQKLEFPSSAPGEIVARYCNEMIIFTNHSYIALSDLEFYSSAAELKPWMISDLMHPRVIKVLRRAINFRDSHNEFASSVLSSVANDLNGFLETLKSAILADSIAALNTALIPIIGRGPGLTPSGDDFLMGTMIADKLSVQHSHCFEHLLIDAVSQRSTKISADIIKAASELELDERLVTLYKFAVGQIELTDDDLSTALSWGGSSGLDFLSGLCWRISIIK